jgi:hypothetical protein
MGAVPWHASRLLHSIASSLVVSFTVLGELCPCRVSLGDASWVSGIHRGCTALCVCATTNTSAGKSLLHTDSGTDLHSDGDTHAHSRTHTSVKVRVRGTLFVVMFAYGRAR